MSPGTDLPESFRATDSTASSVMSTGMKICVSLYISNIVQEGPFLIGLFSTKDVTIWLIVSVRFPAKSSGYKILYFYISQTNRMALHKFPFRKILKNVRWRSYVVCVQQAFPRYPIVELYVSLTRYPNAPRFHKWSQNKMRYQICAELLMPWVRWRKTD